MKPNISHIHDCFGCGVCATICPKNIIAIDLNRDGFYEPHIVDMNKCIHCGLCVDVCAFSHEELALPDARPLKSWGAWSNDEQVRRKCSSGGIGFEIGRHLLQQGYQVCGVKYDVARQRAEHFIAHNLEELVQTTGSKYIQSYTVDGFKAIDRKQKYLVTGTPCQIDSFRRYIRKLRCEDNFVLMDFFCHCVPSMWAWKQYLQMVEKKVGPITYASWRNKFDYGWHDSWIMGMDGEKTAKPIDWHDSYNLLIREKKTFVQSRMSQGDLFYQLFLGDISLGKQCYKNCRFKYNHSSADIRIGDFWGDTYKDDEKGVSCLIAYTQKGCDLIESLENVTLHAHPFEVVAEGQMKDNAHADPLRNLFIKLLSNGVALDGLTYKGALLLRRIVSKVIYLTK